MGKGRPREGGSSGPTVLVFDIGSSSVRCLAFEAGGRRVPGSLCRASLSMRHGAGGAAGLDPEQVFEKFLHVARGSLRALGGRAGCLEGVAISCFWHSLIGLDGRGRALTPVLMWADLRSGPQAGALRGRLSEESYRRRTGCYLHPAYLPAKLLWLRDQDPGLYGRVRRWVSMDGYILGRLQGEYGMGHAMAAGTGLYDQGLRDWDDEILDLLGLSRDRFPALRPFARPRRGVRKPYGDLPGPLLKLPVFPALPDGYCAQAGSGCLEAGRPALTLGTSGALRVTVPGESPPEVPDGLWCYRVEQDRFLVGGAVNNVGNLFSWLRKSLSLPAPGRERGAAARLKGLSDRCPPGKHGLTVLPFLQGERSPWWPLEASGVVAGLTSSTTPREIYQACFESMGFQFARIHRLLEKGKFVKEEEIRVSGGFREPFLLNAFAHTAGRPLRILPEREVSSLGAANRAARALGIGPREEGGPLRASGRCFKPSEKDFISSTRSPVSA